jgi:hypothetical protein
MNLYFFYIYKTIVDHLLDGLFIPIALVVYSVLYKTAAMQYKVAI